MELKQVGMIVLSAIAIIVCISLLMGGGISNSVGEMTATRNVGNATVSSAPYAVVTLQGKVITNFVATNQSTGDAIPASNYTVANNVILTDGTLGATVTWHNGTTVKGATSCNISYTYEPLGYVSEAGGRSIVSLIIIFSALAIAIVALWPTLSSGVLELTR